MGDPRVGSIATVQRLNRTHAPIATRVLCEAFYDYPVMRYVLGPASEAYDRRISTLIGMFVMARVLRAEPILGVMIGSDVGAVALLSDPAGPSSPRELALLREEVWAELGSATEARYEAFGRAASSLTVSVPHVHLNMLGVRPDLQGRGLSTHLLREVHCLAEDAPGCQGVTLTTEDSANIPLYAHFGYEVIGHARVHAELETWGLFRPN